jgi:hypothetical protein
MQMYASLHASPCPGVPGPPNGSPLGREAPPPPEPPRVEVTGVSLSLPAPPPMATRVGSKPKEELLPGVANKGPLFPAPPSPTTTVKMVPGVTAKEGRKMSPPAPPPPPPAPAPPPPPAQQQRTISNPLDGKCISFMQPKAERSLKPSANGVVMNWSCMPLCHPGWVEIRAPSGSSCHVLVTGGPSGPIASCGSLLHHTCCLLCAYAYVQRVMWFACTTTLAIQLSKSPAGIQCDLYLMTHPSLTHLPQ